MFLWKNIIENAVIVASIITAAAVMLFVTLVTAAVSFAVAENLYRLIKNL